MGIKLVIDLKKLNEDAKIAYMDLSHDLNLSANAIKKEFKI
ncbi:MAG: hypothetical protein Q8P57_03215 [Candidatus Pacearchaeota archaeon]|nr:hypothetical protein [Candidatus Pacearchaeota archaeon]